MIPDPIKVLAKLEWAGEGGHREENACPDCGGAPWGWWASRKHKRFGHEDTCELATLLEDAGVPTNKIVRQSC